MGIPPARFPRSEPKHESGRRLRCERHEFRQDLYYRLNVFPIRIPPLRERPEDIPLLVRYFTQKYSRRMEKQIDSIPTVAMKKLAAWHWPGNIRELENFIERSVILTHSSALQLPLGEIGTNGETQLQRARGSPTIAMKSCVFSRRPRVELPVRKGQPRAWASSERRSSRV